MRFDPKKNFEQVEPWVNYFKKQNEVFGYMSARDFFYISFKKGISPKACSKGVITLCKKHRDFDTYRVSHSENRVEIDF